MCAGSAAVALRWISADAAPPLAYMGGKRAYAGAILAALGLGPGGGRARDVVLVEPGPWGDAWDLWRTSAGRRNTIDRLRAFSTYDDPREIWELLADQPVPSDQADRVAAWVVLQRWSFGGRPVVPRGNRWRARRVGFLGDVTRRRHLPIAAIERLPDLSRVTILRQDARTVAPIPGATVYIDPPYSATTRGYAHDLPDPAALALAWGNAGCLVAISDHLPNADLGRQGWYTRRLPPPVGRGRSFSRQQAEWLTLSAIPYGQMVLC